MPNDAPAIDRPEARRAEALRLLQSGDPDQATRLLRDLVGEDGAPTLRWLTEVIVTAMQGDDLTLAGDAARVNATLRYGPNPVATDPEGAHTGGADERKLSEGKLRHDVDQLRYLQRRGLAGPEAGPIIAAYEQIAEELAGQGAETRRSMTADEEASIGHVYGRLTHVRDTPRVDRALSDAWDRREVEDRYLGTPPGVVVIDEFLSPDALEGLQQFCLESTVWNANRYPRGRLGSFIDSGFNCPLLLQIAEEIRAAFPRVIGDRHPLRQLWGFKYPAYLPPASTIHADFAAVNVNFWITPTSASKNPEAAGLVVYDTDAPPEWDFHTYNERLDLIKEFLARSNAKEIRVPYRENRALIFNSDLFHATGEVDFVDAYEQRRINVTMLYGVRERDDLHPGLSAPSSSSPTAPGDTSAWRSAAFRRRGRR